MPYSTYFITEFPQNFLAIRSCYSKGAIAPEAVSKCSTVNIDFGEIVSKQLENYLGIEHSGNMNISREFQRVVRTKTSNTWKDWFLEQGIKFFKPFFSKFIKKYDYPASWKVNKMLLMPPGHCSGYVKRIVEERRQIDRLSLL